LLRKKTKKHFVAGGMGSNGKGTPLQKSLKLMLYRWPPGKIKNQNDNQMKESILRSERLPRKTDANVGNKTGSRTLLDFSVFMYAFV